MPDKLADLVVETGVGQLQHDAQNQYQDIERQQCIDKKKHGGINVACHDLAPVRSSARAMLRCMAAVMAACTSACRSPSAKRASAASVVPPSEVTLRRKTAGSSPVSSAMRAAPRAVCLTS